MNIPNVTEVGIYSGALEPSSIRKTYFYIIILLIICQYSRIPLLNSSEHPLRFGAKKKFFQNDTLSYMQIEELSERHIPYVTKILMDRWEISEEKAHAEINRWILKSDNSICFVGVIKGVPIGFGLFDTQSDADPLLGPWNRQLYVEPQYRGSKYGFELTQKRFAWAKKKGYRTVYLSTEAAKDYHLRFGWQIVREDVKKDKTITIMKYDLIC
ncbi:MAG TPA: GNAT family N-acetyltransferase [Clostridia bacterium]